MIFVVQYDRDENVKHFTVWEKRLRFVCHDDQGSTHKFISQSFNLSFFLSSFSVHLPPLSLKVARKDTGKLPTATYKRRSRLGFF